MVRHNYLGTHRRSGRERGALLSSGFSVAARALPTSPHHINDACFIVRDANGQKLAYVYFEEEPWRRSVAKLRTTPLSFHPRTAVALRMHDSHTSLTDRLPYRLPCLGSRRISAGL
jgi:hypothetical protein